MGAIFVDGDSWPIDARVRTWLETGLKYERLPRRTVTNAIVNHWTGAENPPEVVFANLKKRTRLGLSIHFVIDHEGDIWQFADAVERAAHASIANGWSVGIELINRAHNTHVPTRGVEREDRTEVIHDRAFTYAAFTPAQLKSGVALNEVLADAFGLPLCVPMLQGLVFGRVLPLKTLANYRGCLGHLHLDAGKPDPGLELLQAIHDRGDARDAVFRRRRTT